MTKEFFDIIENHYLYNDINKKIKLFKKDNQVADLFQQYLTYYDLDILQNYNLLKLIFNMNLRNNYSIPESKNFSLEKTIIHDDSSETYLYFFYKSGIITIKDIPTVKNDLSLSIKTTDSSLETCFSLAFSLSGFQSLGNHNQLLEISTIDYESFRKTKRYSLSLHQKEQDSKINRIVLNNVAIEKNSDKSMIVDVIEKPKLIKLYPELKLLTLEQMNNLFLTGGLLEGDVELLKITHDFGNSMDNYIKKNNENVFDMLKDKLKTNNSLTVK